MYGSLPTFYLFLLFSKLEGIDGCDMLEASGKHLNTPSHNGHRLSPVAKEQGSNNSVVGEDIIG